MKIVLTGATGFLGSEVLNQCCQSIEIDTIIVLTRKPLQHDQLHAKVNNFVVPDFKSYYLEINDAISDADACIWCLGGTEVAAEVDYPMTFTQAIIREQGSKPQKFNYVHCSGVLAERNQTKPLWFLQEGRRAKGRGESLLLDVAKEPSRGGLWHTHVMRPSMIMPKEPSFIQRLLGVMLGSVRVDELANASIKLALHGTSSATLENKDLVQLGEMRN